MRGVKSPSASLIKATLLNGAVDLSQFYIPPPEPTGPWDPLSSRVRSFSRPDYHQGWGRVNLMNSVYPGQADASSPPVQLVDFVECKKGIRRTNTGYSYVFRISEEGVDQPVRVTLVWADYPGSPAAGKQLVNDLDLTVIGPGGGWYTSCWNNSEDPNEPWFGDTYDSANNVESLEFYPWGSGTFYVNVQGANIPNSPQPFAIVVTGGLEMPRFSISGTVLGADKLPVISYLDANNYDLKIAHCNDVTCSSATITVLDSTGVVGWYNSITIGADGLPVISYYQFTNGDLKVAHCADVDRGMACRVSGPRRAGGEQGERRSI